jgi:hypothetical protein
MRFALTLPPYAHYNPSVAQRSGVWKTSQPDQVVTHA